MSLRETFNASISGRRDGPLGHKPPKQRPPPFSLRLSPDERARLIAEAAGAPLGSYVKAKLFGAALPVRVRRTGLAVEDRTALAKALALLGSSRISGNLNQLVRLGHIGALPMTPETEVELRATLEDVRAMRRLLMAALGLKPENGP
ncbi:hypothetical protein [Rhizobium sp. CF142]|uniref:hypothetical protein n=1 Tax=Rhizobium sp. CF142 TaxID=1144314 RepID=UPI00026F012A|nr:hypothetical protein [Rhizobium sp. CF142]EJJ27299.1 hypothetical protein PMI11_04311 [Rhizobium sp. CF142]